MRALGLRHTVAGLAVAAVALGAATGAAAREVPDTFAPIAERLLPAVVNISTTKRVEGGPGMPQLPPGSPFKEFFERYFQQRGPQQERELHSLGSGFIIDPEGYVVTNNHVVREADEVTVILQDDTRLRAEIVGRDGKTDLALLRVKAERKLPDVDWGDSDRAKIGDWVLAIGNPFGLGGSVTAGIVAARSRAIGDSPSASFIQTDTAINRGNSGGPLFNTDGQVIGVNTAILSPSGGNIGIGFALPSNVAKPVIQQLKEKGTVTRGWLGVSVQPITDELGSGLDLPERRGALIGSVAPGSPAKRAGLRSGDVILRFGEEAVDDARELARLVAQTPVGKDVTLKVWREGERVELTATIGELSEATARAGRPEEAAKQTARYLGLMLAPPEPQVLDRFGLPSGVKGAVIARIAPGSPAAARGLQPGDVIVKVGRKPVDGPNDVHAAVSRAVDAGKDAIVALVRRGNQARFVALPLSPQAS